MAFVKVAIAAEVPPGTSRVVRAGGREVVVFNVEGQFYCLDNVCPHMEGPLGEGELEGDTVYCPWHAWPVNVRTGEVTYDSSLCTARFQCKVEDDAVLVDI